MTVHAKRWRPREPRAAVAEHMVANTPAMTEPNGAITPPPEGPLALNNIAVNASSPIVANTTTTRRVRVSDKIPLTLSSAVRKQDRSLPISSASNLLICVLRHYGAEPELNTAQR